MQKKYKMTGCARFFIVLIILAPLAYLGAAYYNGEDGIANIKALLGMDNSSSSDDDVYTGTSDDLEKEIKSLKRQIKGLEAENEELKKKLGQALKDLESLQSGNQE